jgi:hypothetical protein
MTKNVVKFEGAFTNDTVNTINQNFTDVNLSTATLTANANTTLANVVGLVTDTMVPGTYRFYVHLIGTAGASGGLKVAFKQNEGLTLTSINSSAQGFTAAAVAVQTVTSTTDVASLLASTSAIIKTVIEGTMVVATAGKIQLQAAQNASNGTDTVIAIGSHMLFTRVV